MELYEFIVHYCCSYWIIVELYDLLGNFVTSTKIGHIWAFLYGATYKSSSNLVTLKTAKVCSSAIRLIYDTENCHMLNMVPEMKTTQKWRWPQKHTMPRCLLQPCRDLLLSTDKKGYFEKSFLSIRNHIAQKSLEQDC